MVSARMQKKLLFDGQGQKAPMKRVVQAQEPKFYEFADAIMKLLHAGQNDLQLIKNDMNHVRREVEELRAANQKLVARVLQIEDWGRKHFSSSTVKTFLAVCLKYFNGVCPCCGESEILTAAGTKKPECEIDHFKGPKWNKVTEGWPICSGCHDKITHGHLARDGNWVEQAFKSFQMRVRQYRESSDKQQSIF